MTDEELGAAIRAALYDSGPGEQDRKLGAAARALLSPPANNAPILRMSVEEIKAAISKELEPYAKWPVEWILFAALTALLWVADVTMKEKKDG